MQARFLLGPAGSGKTHRCLAEIRAELVARPEGLPLVLLAPKQATFQLERQLLASPELAGYTRLHILSFERLADFVLNSLHVPAPDRLSEEGRLMVLRALLARHADGLKLFRASARLPGFAQQLNQVLRELQHYHLLPQRLDELAAEAMKKHQPHLQAKLHDLARLLGAYLDWLKENRLQDSEVLLDFAAEVLTRQNLTPDAASPAHEAPEQLQLIPPARRAPGFAVVADSTEASTRIQGSPQFRLGGLWLDGFAEMTAQELRLLAAVFPCADRAVLAFCLESQPREELPWLSTWSVISRTFRECHALVEALPEVEVTIQVLRRNARASRFSEAPALAHLEAHWTQPVPFDPTPLSSSQRAEAPSEGQKAEGERMKDEQAANAAPALVPNPALRLAACLDSETEAVLAAHEILRFVRDHRGRFRDCAVLLRSFEGYHDVFRRVFARRGIPFFLDRRESVSHHPLAELTRFSLRLAAFGWQHEDWFGALKTGLARANENDLDLLENLALELGWKGEVWRHPLRVASDASRGEWAETVRVRLAGPFIALVDRVRGEVNGRELASALRGLWDELAVANTLDHWSAERSETTEGAPAVHETVWEQMQGWLENLELAFPSQAMRASDWLPILEAGLANLTVGVIPPALDQVLIGTVDRSRNPELQWLILPGFNELVFPAPGLAQGLLSETEREELEQLGARLGPGALRRIGHERYYGYIACTRARRRLVITHARRDGDGRELNPSVFIRDVQRLFPTLIEEQVDALPGLWLEAEHPSELIAPLLRAPRSAMDSLVSLPGLEALGRLAQQLPRYSESERLSPGLAEALYLHDDDGVQVLRSSVSRLEMFAACPFRFFVEAGLRAEERKQFEVDPRERGTLQHEVLERFHHEILRTRRRWRDVSPDEATALIGRLVDESAATYRGGLFQDDERNQFTAGALKDALQRFIRVVIGWMRSYQLDPKFVEAGFGMADGSVLPAWRIPIGNGRELALRGKVDRVDLGATTNGVPWCVVLDYKSGARKLDEVHLYNGLALQLPAYLAALESFAREGRLEGLTAVRPGGMFYANLRGATSSGESRTEVLAQEEAERAAAYRHFGRFNAEAVEVLDAQARTGPSGQFNFKLNQDGTLSRRNADPLEAGAFADLLTTTRQRLAEFGQRILEGEATVDPYRTGSTRACDQCQLASVCRIEVRTHRFRGLAKPPST